MIAIVKMTLVRPTRFGHTIIKKKINAHKAVLKDEVNKFIFERQHRENFIRVKTFDVSIVDYKKRVVDSWSYSPTYAN